MSNQVENAMASTPDVAALKECGSCMLCCKLFPIKFFDKPAGKWCVHAKPGTGCSIHESRPNVCRMFFCEWATNADLGDNWKPDKAKFFIYMPTPTQYSVVVEPSAPNAWKEPQYYSVIKLIASDFTERGGVFIVSIGLRRIVVLPDRDEDLGTNLGGRMVFVLKHATPQGFQYEVKIGDVPPEQPQELV